MAKKHSRSKTSGRWLQEHFDDEYVKKAQKEGYRARAVYKLLEIDEKDRLLKPGMTVVDLGAAPGSWSEVAAQRVGEKGRVIALDILPMDSLPGVTFNQGDFREEGPYNALLEALEGSQVDLVMSDMAPNISGISVSDQARAIYLAELALDFAEKTLRPGGNLLIKVFQGEGFPALHRQMRERFKSLMTRKPQASRSRSREVYLVGKGFLAS